MSAGLALTAGCNDSGGDAPASASTTSSSATSPSVMQDQTSTTVPRAPTSCEEAPNLPACQPGHEDP